MTPERWARIKKLFQEALDLPPDGRQAFVERQCNGDEDLRCEIEALLHNADSAKSFIETPAFRQLAVELSDETRQLIGQRISHYLIEAELGSGGMGLVFKAKDKILDRYVAIKILPEEFATNAERVRRFEREALTVSKLQHANIVTIYEHFSHDGRHVIATEYVEGETLRQLLRRGPLDWREVTRISVQIAAALEAAHHAGVIHRDIKPENVMLQKSGMVKVLDFGIAKYIGQIEQTERGSSPEDLEAVSIPIVNRDDQTRTGLEFYTRGYASPEQVKQDKNNEPDARTDIFSLGVLMYELLTGEWPFLGETPQDWMAALLGGEEAADVRTRCPLVPAALAAIIARALRKSREERYGQTNEMLTDLEALKNDLAVNETGEQIVTKSANRLLTQFTILSLSQPQTRIPLSKLWTTWWVADLPRGKPENELLCKSLFRGLLRSGFWTLMIVLVIAVMAAWLSVTEQWKAEILRDGHTQRLRQIAISPNGEKMVSTSNDATLIVWDFRRRAQLATLQHSGTNAVSAVAFSPDGKWFVTASSDGTIIVWNSERLTKEVTLPGIRRGVSTIAFTPDGHTLITPMAEGKKILWRVGDWQKIGESQVISTTANFLISPNNRLLITRDWLTRDLINGQEVLSCLDYAWNWGALSPDAHHMVTVDNGGFVAFWDISRLWLTGERRLIQRVLAHRERGRAIAYSPNGRLVASGGENIIIWDAQTQEKLFRFDSPDRIASLAFSPDGRSLISAHDNGAILIWDLEEKEAVAGFTGHCAPVRVVKFSPDGRRIASAGDDGSVIVWNAVNGKKEIVLSAHRTRVSGVAFSNDGQRLVSSDLQGYTIIWELASGKPMLTIEPRGRSESSFGHCVAISPDDRWIATNYGIYSASDGIQVLDLRRQDNQLTEFYDLAFSPNGHWLAGVSPSRDINLWEIGTWKLSQSIKERAGQFIAVSFSNDSRWLVTGEDQGNIRLWQVEPLQEIAVIGQHKSFIRSVAFSPDGKEIVSASDDQTLSLWSVSRRKLLAQIGVHTSPVYSVSFAPDGKRIASGEHDKSVRIYTRQQSLWGWKLD